MGGTRAVATLRTRHGYTFYCNSLEVARMYLDKILDKNAVIVEEVSSTSPNEVDVDRQARAHIDMSVPHAHKLLNGVAGKGCTYFNEALCEARAALPQEISVAMKKLQKMAGVAKHSWPEDGKTDGSFAAVNSQLDTLIHRIDALCTKVDQRVPEVAAEELPKDPSELPPAVGTVSSDNSQTSADPEKDEKNDMQSFLDVLQTPIDIPVPEPTTEDEVKNFCKQFFDQKAGEVRSATDKLRHYLLAGGNGDENNFKEILSMGATLLRDLRIKLDDAENQAIARILTSLRPPLPPRAVKKASRLKAVSKRH